MTSLYNPQQKLDTKSQRYMGFKLKIINSPNFLIEDLEYKINAGLTLKFYDFCDLESIIAAMIYQRNKNPALADQKLNKMMDVWRELREKPEFKKAARKRLKDGLF